MSEAERKKIDPFGCRKMIKLDRLFWFAMGFATCFFLLCVLSARAEEMDWGRRWCAERSWDWNCDTVGENVPEDPKNYTGPGPNMEGVVARNFTCRCTRPIRPRYLFELPIATLSGACVWIESLAYGTYKCCADGTGPTWRCK